MTYSKVRWKVLELAMINNITGVATALIILLIIGALSGSWMISGVVPTLIYYGMQIIHPSFFLASTCIICAVVSVMTGSSWTTIATIGIALLGIGQAQGFSDGWIAGAIISGAYFGDKISPLSDTTILASSVTDTPLFKHIRYMMITTVPSMLITLVIFTVAGLSHEATATDQIEQYSIALNNTFHITPWLLIVPVVTGILIAKRVPSIITLFISAALAGMFALIFQPHLLLEISGLPVGNIQSNFKGLLMTFYGSTSIKTGNPELNSLVEYDLADPLCHVLRRGDGGKRNVGQHHFRISALYETDSRAGNVDCRIGTVPQHLYGRPIYFHHLDWKYVQGYL